MSELVGTKGPSEAASDPKMHWIIKRLEVALERLYKCKCDYSARIIEMNGVINEDLSPGIEAGECKDGALNLLIDKIDKLHDMVTSIEMLNEEFKKIV